MSVTPSRIFDVVHLLMLFEGAIEEATAGYDARFKACSLDMLHWSQGLFGFVANLGPLLECLQPGLVNHAPQAPPVFNGDLSISELQIAYRQGLSPVSVAQSVLGNIKKYLSIDPAVWIYREPSESVLEQVKLLETRWPDRDTLPPLFGIPFSVKDNIDIAGLPTTTACPPLTRQHTKNARIYDILISQGAIFVGKTNLDQLATGLTGCRSPYGIPHSAINHDYIAGGSSSGSCVSVGANLVSFSICTDTGGSGRVPAGFNGVVGFKPTKGTVSTQGVTPACMSLDSIAIIAKNIRDARTIWDLSVGLDEEDRYAKTCAPLQRHINATGPQLNSFRFGIPPPQALSVCNPIYLRKFTPVVKLLQRLGGSLCPVDWTPFAKAGSLLYESSFVCERLANLPENFLARYDWNFHPVITTIFSDVLARKYTAIDAHRDLQAQALYTRQVEKIFEYSASGIDVLVVPTAPTQYTVEEVLRDPVGTNTLLGEFSHFANVLDLCGVAVPAGKYTVGELRAEEGEVSQESKKGDKETDGELPFSVTLLGGRGLDAEVLGIAERLEAALKKG